MDTVTSLYFEENMPFYTFPAQASKKTRHSILSHTVPAQASKKTRHSMELCVFLEERPQQTGGSCTNTVTSLYFEENTPFYTFPAQASSDPKSVLQKACWKQMQSLKQNHDDLSTSSL